MNQCCEKLLSRYGKLLIQTTDMVEIKRDSLTQHATRLGVVQEKAPQSLRLLPGCDMETSSRSKLTNRKAFTCSPDLPCLAVWTECLDVLRTQVGVHAASHHEIP